MCSTAACAEPSAPVNRVVRFSCVDGPGNRTAIFLQGCPFSCLYCHNPETIRECVSCGECVSVCPAGALSMTEGKVRYDPSKCCMCDACIKTCKHLSCPRIRVMTASLAMAEVRRNMPFIRGVTLSGGECTVHRDFCVALAHMCRAEGLGILLDSNGSLDFSADPVLTGAVDGVMLDVKAWNEADHVALTGMSAAIVKQNLTFLAVAGKLEEVRTVVVPGITDPEETVSRVCETLRAVAPGTRYKLIRYRPMGVRGPYRSTLTPPDDALMASLEDRAHRLGIKNTVLL